MDRKGVPDNIEAFFDWQLNNWELAKLNYKQLEGVKTKEFRFGEFTVKVQFNPARVQSSTAKTDAASIRERKCFLCPGNLPVEQKGIPLGDKYQILVNPYPIFPRHFTIPILEHTPQLIAGRYTDMLKLAEQLDNYIVFYNGPKCGASAPDHMHFQAALKGYIPITEELTDARKQIIVRIDNSSVYTLSNYLRNVFIIESDDINNSVGLFEQIYNALKINEGEDEPMINVLSWKDRGSFYTCVFPREKHRPGCYYAEGEKNLLISPASVDLGGMFIVPFEKDFDKINKPDIIAVLKEVCINDEKMQRATRKIMSLL